MPNIVKVNIDLDLTL